jgi:hypothetical protein
VTILFWAYFCAFLVWSAAGVYDSVESDRGAGFVLLEVTSVVAAAAGMLLYWFEWTFPGI